MKEPFCFFLFFFFLWNAGKNAQSSALEIISTITHFVDKFGATCHAFLFCSFLLVNAGKNAQSCSSTTSAPPASQTEGMYTFWHIPFGVICRDSMSTPVWCHVLSHYSYRWRNLFLPFFPFEMQVKTPSRPRQRNLSQLHKRKVFTPYHIFLLEPCVGTVCPHKFGVMF